MNDETARTAWLIKLYLRRFPKMPFEVEVILLSALVVVFIYGAIWWLYV
jgi:hypothetical protein